MSLILDALRKSDRQRSRNVAERLREGPPPAASPSLPAWTTGLLVTAALLAAVAVVIVLRPMEAPVTERNATGRNSGIMENKPGAQADVRSLGGELARETSADVPVSMVTPRATAPAPGAESAAQLAALPLAALPAEFRRKLPPLHIDIHAWAEDPDARFVLINLRRYEEGDRLLEGPTVRQILRNGAVLEFEDTLFLLSR